MHTVNFDDLDTTTQSVIPAPFTYNWLAFHPSWQVARVGNDIPFVPSSQSNALVLPTEFASATAEFYSVSACDTFDLISLWIIGCWVNPKYFKTDEACIVTFTGTKADGSIVTWERPVRKTSMEIIQFSTSRGFTNLKKVQLKSRFEFGTTTAGRIALDDIVIGRQDGKVSC